MKYLLISCFILNFAFSNDLELKSYVGFEYKSYIKQSGNKKDYNKAVTFENELKYSFSDSKIYSKINILEDLDEKKRDYIDFTELYFSHSFKDFDFYLGKKIIFLGSLEASNIVDVFNRQNYQKDVLSKNKKGAILSGINYYFEDDSRFDFFIKGFEEKNKLVGKDSVYYAFVNNDYKEDLLFATKKEEPSYLLNYSKTYYDEINADISFGLFYGYDNYLLYKKTDDYYQTMLFQSLKVFTYNTFVLDSSLIKFEASYTKIQEDEDFNIKDFYELGFGGEYTFESIFKNHNLGLIAEYYKSNSVNTSLDNDLFLALRYSLNDKDSSEFLLGLVKDLENDDFSSYLKYEGRLSDAFKVSSDLRYIKNDSYLQEHFRFGCEIKYFF